MMGRGGPDEEDLMEKRQRQQRHMNLQQQAPEEQSGRLHEYAELIDPDLDTATLEILDMLISKDYALGNLTEADIHELKWLREITKLKLFAVHPSDDTAMKGKKRKLAYTKNGEGDGGALPLEPLDEYERLRIDEIIRVAHNVASRSKGGFQWDQVAKSYSVSEIRDSDDEQEGWLSF